MTPTRIAQALALAGATALTLYGCGGGGGSAAGTGSVAISTTVIDGAIRNALVCLDRNSNGACDSGEPSGRTDANGNLTLMVDQADAGKYPLLTVVGTDAVDADHGPVTVPFAMSAPPGKPGVISPLTTMVVQAMANGLTEAEAETAVKDQTGIVVSLFEDFTKAAVPVSGPKPGDIARMIVVATQAQGEALKASLGVQALDGSTITDVDLKKAVQKNILSILPTLVQETQNASGAANQAAKENAVVSAVSSSFLQNVAAVQVAVGATNQARAVEAAVAPSAGWSLDTLAFTDGNNWNWRGLMATATQATPDANGWRQVMDRRYRKTSGQVAAWNFGSGAPLNQAVLFWNGSAWSGFPLDFVWNAQVPDAQGKNLFDYGPGWSRGSNTRATFDISGQTMLSVYQQMRGAGYTNVDLGAGAAGLLGAAVFPAESRIQFIESTDLFKSVGYNQGSGAFVFRYPAEVSNGGDQRLQAAGTGCNHTSFQSGPALAVATLENLVDGFRGSVCVGNQSSFTSNGVTYYEGGSQGAIGTSEFWGNSTLGIGTIGTVSTGAVPTAFYTGNKLIRVGFQGSASNAVTYYSCDQRFINGSVRNCKVIGTGNWTIEPLGDARVMRLSNPPPTALTFHRVFIERGGRVWAGYQDKMGTRKVARLQTVAATAFHAQLGLPVPDPNVPLALTATSYQGTWDVRDVGVTFAFNVGARFVLNPDGSLACTDNTNNAAISCTLSSFNPATGAIRVTNNVNGNYLDAVWNFLTGQITGAYFNSSNVKQSDVTGQRR